MTEPARKRAIRIIENSILAAALSALLACGPLADATAAPCTGARAPDMALRRIIDADNARDIERALDGYTSDIVWLPPARPPLVGIDAVRDSYEKMYSLYKPSLSIDIDETIIGERLAMVRGATRGDLTPNDGPAIAVHDTFLAVLKCERGDWRVARMMWGPAAVE